MEAKVTPETVREFWFGEPEPSAAEIEERIDFWFDAGPDVDAEIRRRFADAVRGALAGRLDSWRNSPADRLALVILLDQFPRNIYRGTCRAYSGDQRALALSLEAIDDQADRALAVIERAFLYMPLQHAEYGESQRRSVELFKSLVDASPDGLRAHMNRFLASARTHRDIVERFGRFPHRNGILGRECTRAEIEFLRKPAAPFRSKS